MPNANRRWLDSVAPRLREAVARGAAAPPLTHPSKAKRRRSPWTDDSRRRWTDLAAARKKEALALNIGPAVLWPTRSLEAIALDPARKEEELSGTSAHNVRNWQRKTFGPFLTAALRASSAG